MANGWLPDPLDETACDIGERYGFFRRDYIEAPPDVFAPKTFEIDNNVGKDGREEAFYHLTTSGQVERKHDPYRCGRIHWGKPVIQQVDAAHVVTWRVRQKGEDRIKIALQNFEYLVVVAEESSRVRLVTAFYVHDGKQREKIEKESLRPPEQAVPMV